MSLVLRKATVADREAVLALLAEAGVPNSMVDLVVALEDDEGIGAAVSDRTLDALGPLPRIR